VGEILIVFTAILDFIRSNPLHTQFKFSSDQIEHLLANLVDKEIGQLRLFVSDPNLQLSAETGVEIPVR